MCYFCNKNKDSQKEECKKKEINFKIMFYFKTGVYALFRNRDDRLISNNYTYHMRQFVAMCVCNVCAGCYFFLFVSFIFFFTILFFYFEFKFEKRRTPSYNSYFLLLLTLEYYSLLTYLSIQSLNHHHHHENMRTRSRKIR